MTRGFGSLGELARVKLADRRHTELRVSELAAEIYPLDDAKRNERWSEIIGQFVERQRAANIPGHEIKRTVETLATLVAANLSNIQRDETARIEREIDAAYMSNK